MHRRALVSLLFTVLGGLQIAQKRTAIFELKIPEANLTVPENRSAQLGHSFVNRLQLRVFRPPHQINYGSVYVRINGESANTLMTAKADPEGVVCELNLNLRSGFRLLPGRNSVEVSAVDFYGRKAYASFLIDIGAEGRSGTDIRTETHIVNTSKPVPQLQLLNPSQAVVAGESPIFLEGQIFQAAEDTALAIDGESVALEPSSGTRGLAVVGRTPDARFQHKLTVPAEAAEIRVEARNRYGNRSAVLIPVLSAPALLTNGSGEKYAVVIGVSRHRYHSPVLPNLHYADADAFAFRDFLLSQRGGKFRPANVLTLVNEDATIHNVRTALFTFLARAREGDLIVVYIAGHGAPDPNNLIDLYFLTHDSDPLNMGATALPMWQMRDLFARTLKSKRVITFADTCHSAGIGSQIDEGHNLVNQYLYKYASVEGRAVMTASDIGEFSEESEQWGGGHGVFTYFLCEALSGKGDSNGDGTISAAELFEYVHRHVSEATKGRQNPVALPGMVRHQPLFEVGADR